MSKKELTYSEVASLKGTSAFADANNDFFTNIANKICESIVDQSEYTSKVRDFYISESEVSGDGVETIVYPDFIAKEMSNKTCCLTECGECITQPLSEILPNEKWNRLCGTFSEEQLYTAFCRGSDALAKLADGMLKGMRNARVKWMDDKAIAQLNDLSKFWVDGVQGQQISSSNAIEDVFGVILELNTGTNRYNKIRKYWETPIWNIFVISNPDGYKRFAVELSNRCQPLFTNCPTEVDCKQLNWKTMNIADDTVIVMDRRFLKAWEVFVRLKSREDEACLRTNWYEHFKVGVQIDNFYNGVSIKYNTGDAVDDQKNANEIKQTISGITGVDLNVSANDEATAKPLIEALINGKVSDKKGLELVYSYSDFKAPVDADTDGSYKVRVDIKKGTTVFASIEKTFVLKFKALSQEQMNSVRKDLVEENKILNKKLKELEKLLKAQNNGEKTE